MPADQTKRCPGHTAGCPRKKRTLGGYGLIKHAKKGWILLVVIVGLLCQGCAHHFALPENQQHAVYLLKSQADSQLLRSAPAWLTYGFADRYNRIGAPTARGSTSDSEKVWVDTEQPVVYTMQRPFATAGASYTNYIYRIHFPRVPYRVIPFNLTAGDHPGLLVVITVNKQNQPVLITSVGTCGCYKAFVPTDYLPDHSLPADWQSAEKQDIYGEHLPARLMYKNVQDPVLLIHLRPGVHRVMDLEVVPAEQLGNERYMTIPMTAAPMDALLHLPTDDGAGTSFYFLDGWRKGYVKGSIKPFEMVFMSLISLDLFVGSDKVYSDPAEWENRFYTSLKPWRRDDSDMWDFARFLKYWGWRL